MRKRLRIGLFLIAIVVLIGGFKIYKYYQNHYVSSKIFENILERKEYSINKEDKVNVEIAIKPEWIPFETDKPQNQNIELDKSHNTNIVLQQVWNRGNDIYFSFHTTYDVGYNNGEFLYNMIINEDRTYTSAGSPEDFVLTDLQGNGIHAGQTGYGPGSDYSFGIEPSEYNKIKNGFKVKYSGMTLYEYSRK
ncbi:hypothetical protein [Paenibacillus sp. NFR01]|uniref:hypothetical protein n=1 Tax=Paenibacillus sp. NFR01 TaxID=1566279 RepID=UPI000B870DB4|nr:hypothetical protein [Paenibacillus sp. NFR01]